MLIHFDQERASDSPFIERVWSSHTERAGTFLSVASCHWELVITRLQGRSIVTLRGPETKPWHVPCPANGEWLAIRFKAGTYMPQLPVQRLINNLGVNLPQLSKRDFLLDGQRWELPTFENAEAFVRRLANKGLLARDPEVAAWLGDELPSLSTRTAQRRFQSVVGMSHTSVRQIERARLAVQLLRENVAIADVVWRCGYYDHAHLTRSLQRWIGIPPTGANDPQIQLSFLYKTRESASR
jgi:hypothetical protein